MMRPPLFRLFDMSRTVGVPRALWAVPGWVLRRDFIVLVRDLRVAVPEPRRLPNVRWARLTDEDLARVRTIDPGLPTATVESWHADGRQCLVGWCNDTPAYVRWDTTTSGSLSFLHRTLRLLEGDAYSGHAFTVPAFRGCGLHQAGQVMALDHARRSGCARAISIVARWNIPGLKVAEHAGFERTGTVGFWTVGTMRVFHASGSARLAGRTEFYVARC